VRKSFFVYVIATNRAGLVRTYVGWTNDLDARLAKHNCSRGAKATRGQLWILIYAERLKSRVSAMRREWALKHDRAFRNTLRATARGVLD
jgi:putative endonuclease